MQAILKRGIIIKKFINTIKDFILVLNINIDNLGITFQGIEDTNIALGNLNLNFQIFDEFIVKQAMNFEISLSHLVKVFKGFEEEDTMMIQADDVENSLHFIFQNKLGDTESTFTIPMIVDQSQSKSSSQNNNTKSNKERKFKSQLPDIEYTNAIVMQSHEMTKICSELKNLASVIEIDTNKEYVRFNVSKNDVKGSNKGIDYIEGGYVQIGTNGVKKNTKLFVSIRLLMSLF